MTKEQHVIESKAKATSLLHEMLDIHADAELKVNEKVFPTRFARRRWLVQQRSNMDCICRALFALGKVVVDEMKEVDNDEIDDDEIGIQDS